ncbi:MAG TPA: hypothetical protein IAA61_06500 [Candidatus Ornithomonoglobus merdipullorum]|uniref:Uncharacterized protein n=1 Tax=Candidatus Ornithomonoglobus merdipullorum TaxID=2840895 RepID=A0A9D1MC01_9FIRM|nr:hypothetical protein [Candidatus Ornithomonoglobus merdipullorum]
MDFLINKHLFAAYCGLISSGYSLTDLSDIDIRALYNRIQKITFDSEISTYFSFAKTNTIEVNPYYPRGSDLSAACFFLENDINEYMDFLRFCNSSSANDEEFIKWIKNLKKPLKAIENHAEFGSLFAAYEQIINNRFADINRQLRNFKNKIKDFYGFDVQFVFVPNLLQSKYLTDFVFKNNTLYIISNSFSQTAAAHEYFHIVLNGKKNLLGKLMKQIDIDNFVDTDAMIRFGYMQDESVNSKINAIEDCIIRAMCGVLTEDTEAYCKMNIECGFIGVPAMVEKIKETDLSCLDIDKIISNMAEIH